MFTDTARFAPVQSTPDTQRMHVRHACCSAASPGSSDQVAADAGSFVGSTPEPKHWPSGLKAGSMAGPMTSLPVVTVNLRTPAANYSTLQSRGLPLSAAVVDLSAVRPYGKPARADQYQRSRRRQDPDAIRMTKELVGQCGCSPSRPRALPVNASSMWTRLPHTTTNCLPSGLNLR